jgi:hypothetical protein
MSSDAKIFFQAAHQECYKLGVPVPRLYFYNGYLERAFVFQNNDRVSIVLNKVLLDTLSIYEFKAICFELLLQVKKGMAAKRTKSMFVLGFISWTFHAVTGLILKIIPVKDVRMAGDWFVGYLMHPVLNLIYSIILGKKYFIKLRRLIDEYPFEKEILEHFALKLTKPAPHQSLVYLKVLNLNSISTSFHYQNIMTLEFLPHELDYLFKESELTIA